MGAAFRNEFGAPQTRLPVLPLGDESPLGRLVAEARKSPLTRPSGSVRIRNLRGETKAFIAEAFSTGTASL